MLSDIDAAIERVVQRLSGLTRLCCLTGAGISAESGVPTFRGRGGLWQGHRAEDLATPQAFAQDPQLVWRFYNHRREALRACKPNPAHVALAEFEGLVEHWTLVTQNVDGLHRQAGSRNVIELHGNIWRLRCLKCAAEFDTVGQTLGELPKCEACEGLLRPAVVWFGELLPEGALAAAQQAVSSCQAMLVVGTSSVVQPAASMAYWAKSQGAAVIEINLEPTPLSGDADECLFGKAATIVPRLLDRLPREQFSH